MNRECLTLYSMKRKNKRLVISRRSQFDARSLTRKCRKLILNLNSLIASLNPLGEKRKWKINILGKDSRRTTRLLQLALWMTRSLLQNVRALKELQSWHNRRNRHENLLNGSRGTCRLKNGTWVVGNHITSALPPTGKKERRKFVAWIVRRRKMERRPRRIPNLAKSGKSIISRRKNTRTHHWTRDTSTLAVTHGTHPIMNRRKQNNGKSPEIGSS